jgi:hypothetical protein
VSSFAGTQISDRIAVDENLSHAQVNTTPLAPGAVDFSSGTTTSLVTQTIGGGQLGANGVVEVVGYCIFACSSATSITATMSVSSTSLAVVTASIGTGATYGIEIRGVVQCVNSETTQMSHLSILSARADGADDAQTRRTGTGSYADTSADWVFGLSIRAASASATNAQVLSCRVYNQYLP